MSAMPLMVLETVEEAVGQESVENTPIPDDPSMHTPAHICESGTSCQECAFGSGAESSGSGSSGSLQDGKSSSSKQTTDEYDTDLEIEEARSEFDITGKRVYEEVCKQFGVVPVSSFLRHMLSPTLKLCHHGLGPLGVKAIAIPLVTNTSVLELDLEDNWLSAEGARYISSMLTENCYISHLNLAENHIGHEGCVDICEMLLNNVSLTHLNLSGNNFGDKDAALLAAAILENGRLKELNLSHNEFGDGAGAVLGHAIGENESLDSLDLSWNHFRRRSGVDIIEGIKVNSRLKTCDLSYNGLANEGALALSECFKFNSILTLMDVSNNRIPLEAMPFLAKGLDQNESLVELQIGNNPIGPPGAMMLLSAVNNERSVLKTLGLRDVLVEKEFCELHKEMQESGRELSIYTGGTLSDYVITGKYVKPKLPGPPENDLEGEALNALNNFLKNDPMAIIKTHVEKNNLRMLDFFNQFDKNKDYKVSADDFKKGVKNAGIGITDEQIDALIDSLENKDKDGKIDYRPFLSSGEAANLQ